MNILFQSLDISYFKGIHSLHIDFMDGITAIHGGNGTGKTTIADAIFWLLFDKSSLGATKFNQRTLDSNGFPIPNVENSVTLSLTLDGVPHTLKKQLITKTDSYGSTQKAASSSTAKFFINGQSYTKSDYNAFIASNIITEDTFRIITSPTHFFSLPWAKQREILTSLTKCAPDSATINADGKFDIVIEALQSKQFSDAEAFAKHVSYQISEVKKRLDLIPTQIEEQKRTMPEPQKWDTLTSSLATFEQQKSDLEAQLRSLSTPTETSASALIRQQLEFQHKRIDDIKKSSRFMADKAMTEYTTELRTNTDKLAEYERSLASHNTQKSTIESHIAQCNNNIADAKLRQEKVRTDWKAMVERKFTPTADLTCPTCGQPLPYDKVQEANAKALATFNESKAHTKAALTEEANYTKAIIARAENDLRKHDSDLNVVVGQIEATQIYISNLKDKIKLLRSNTPKTAEELTTVNTGYHDALHRIEELEARLNSEQSATVDEDAVADLQDKLINILADIEQTRNLLATKAIYDLHASRITELEESQTALRSQYDELLKAQDQCKGYFLKESSLLEEGINHMFRLVRFSLFRHLVNGEIEPYCTATHNGVPYADVNAAMKINLGLDICDTLASHYNIIAPIICDNAEGCNSFLSTQGQQIRLYVTKDTSLDIRHLPL